MNEAHAILKQAIQSSEMAQQMAQYHCEKSFFYAYLKTHGEIENVSSFRNEMTEKICQLMQITEQLALA